MKLAGDIGIEASESTMHLALPKSRLPALYFVPETTRSLGQPPEKT